ncbi:MAG: hypothetical protein J6A01_10435 [Proteobacteria bacterium]|nr:hypothetical protein [Pseudomonadota bacterium]
MPENTKTLKSSPAPAEPTKQPETKSAETEAPKTNEELFSEALTANSAADALAVLQSCSPDELKSFGANDSMMENVLNLNAGDGRSACMDMLYMYVTTTDILERFTETRFGVNLGSGSKQGNKLANQVHETTTDKNHPEITYERHERSWDNVGIQRLYTCYLALPQSHIDVVDSVLTTSTTKRTNGTNPQENSRWGGVAYYGYSSYVADYDSSTPNRINATSYCTNDQDASFYNPMMDTTMVHELGHLVDGSNHQYAWSDEFLGFNGWHKIAGSRKSKKKFVNQIIEDCTVDPFKPLQSDDDNNQPLTDEELKLAKLGAEQLIAEHESSCTSDTVEKALLTASKGIGYQFTQTVKKGAEAIGNFFTNAWNWVTGKETEKKEKADPIRSLGDLADYLVETPVYQHILKTAMCFDGRIPCYQIDNNSTTSYMDNVTFEGYDGREIWQVSLKNWNGNKISCYQFRCPEEDFAETYACYHVSKMQRQLHEGEADAGTKYKGILPEVQDWFERMGLHQDPPVEKAKASDEPLGQ